MGRCIKYEQFDDEIYVSEGNNLIGIITDMDRDNYYFVSNDNYTPIPFHGLDSVKRFLEFELK